MATRAMAFVRKDTGYKGCYIHFDGYIECAGYTLIDNYDEAKFSELLDKCGGVINSLEETTEATLDSNNKIFQGKEQIEKCSIDANLEDLCCGRSDIEFIYVLKDGKWHYADLYISKKDGKYDISALNEVDKDI